MASCDLWLLLKLKIPLKNTQFESRREHATVQLNSFKKKKYVPTMLEPLGEVCQAPKSELQ